MADRRKAIAEAHARVAPAKPQAPLRALDKQVGGRHYKGLKIQPVEYAHANNLPFLEGTIVKHVTRWRDKNGLEDLEKAKHYLEILIDLEKKKQEEQDDKL